MSPIPYTYLGVVYTYAVKTHILIFQVLKLKSKPESPRTLWPIQAPEYVQIVIIKKVWLGHRTCSYSEVGSDDEKKKIKKKSTALGIFRYKDIIFLGLFILDVKSSFGFMFKLVSDGVWLSSSSQTVEDSFVSQLSLCLTENRAFSQVEQSPTEDLPGSCARISWQATTYTTPASSSPAGATFFLPIAKIINYLK